MLSRGRICVVFAVGALFSATAGIAHAADSNNGNGKPVELNVRSEKPVIPNSGLKSMKWDARKGRWGVTLNLEEPDARPSSLNDVQAGAYYHITPSLRVGGAVALGEQEVKPGPKKIGQEENQPRVRLESSFKF